MHVRLCVALLYVANLMGQSTAPVAAAAPQTPTEIKPASLSGKVQTADGRPIRKAILGLRSVGGMGPPPYSVVSDAEGKFLFEAVDPGRYILSAERAGYQPLAYGARRPRAAGTVFSLAPGQTLSDLNFVLSPKIILSGKILDSDGDPVAKVAVNAMRFTYESGKRELTVVGSGWSDDNGDYKIDDLWPGKYYLCAVPLRYVFRNFGTRSASAPPAVGQPPKKEEAQVATYYPGVTDFAAAAPIELAAGRDQPGTDITVRKSSVFRIRGRVTGTVLEDRSQLGVSLIHRSSAMGRATMDATRLNPNGSFEIFPVSPGSYLLLLTSSQRGYKVLGFRPLEIAGRNVDDVTLTAEPTVDLTGRVVLEQAQTQQANQDAAATPDRPRISPNWPSVILQSSDGFRLAIPSTPSDNPNSFHLLDVSPGRYQTNVYSLPKGTYLKAIHFGDQDLLRNLLNVSPGDASTQIELTLGLTTTKLAGDVEDADGKAVTPSTVTLVPDPPAPERQDLYKQASTDQNGRFTLDSIAPGKYRIYAWTNFEPDSQFDPDFMKSYESKGVKLDLSDSANQQLKLTPVDL